jgi:nucleoside-diphosphate-sugar epimerase
MVYGPNVNTVKSLDHLNTSSAEIYHLMDGSQTEVPEAHFFGVVDARDLGEAHALAYESSEAAGQRYLVSGGGYTFQQVCDIIRKNFPQKAHLVPEGTPGAPYPDVYKLDNSKAEKELGITFRDL